MYDLILVDGNNRARAAYSHPDEEVTTTFLNDLKTLVRRTVSKRIIVLFDHPNSSNPRRQIYPDYKNNREEDPGAKYAVAECALACTAQGIPIWWDENYEADDLMSSIIQASSDDRQILVYSSDRDLYRNVRQNVTQLNASLFNERHEFMTPQKVLEKYGVTPEQWVDYYALKGDSGDGIPGVKDIGPTTAVKLIQKFGSLDAMVLGSADLGIQEFRAAKVRAAIADGTLALMRKLVAANIVSPVPESVWMSINHWENPWLVQL